MVIGGSATARGARYDPTRADQATRAYREAIFGRTQGQAPTPPPAAPGGRAGRPQPQQQQRSTEELRAFLAGSRMNGPSAKAVPKMFEDAEKEDLRRAREEKADAGPSAVQLRSARAWNQAMRRELTDQEWGRLNSKQQTQVLLNNDLVKAYDADMAESPEERRNTGAVLSQLGLDPARTKSLTEGLGAGLGPAVRYSDLFDDSGAAITPNTTPSQYGGPTPGTVARPVDARQRLINSISANLGTYLAGTEAARTEKERAAALAAKDTYTFKSPQAKADYEASLDYILNKSALSETTWSYAAEGLRSAGYDPEDFKRYARDRIKLMPGSPDMTSLQELDSWFGTE